MLFFVARTDGIKTLVLLLPGGWHKHKNANNMRVTTMSHHSAVLASISIIIKAVNTNCIARVHDEVEDG